MPVLSAVRVFPAVRLLPAVRVLSAVRFAVGCRSVCPCARAFFFFFSCGVCLPCSLKSSQVL